MRVLILFALCFPLLAFGRIDLDVTLIPEGSVAPPGDKIDVTLTFGDAEGSYQLEVIALLDSDDKKEGEKKKKLITSVHGKTKAFQGEKGFFKVVIKDVKPQEAKKSGVGISHYEITIPFSELVLPKGENLKLGYVVNIVDPDDGSTINAAATEILPISVTDKVRKEMVKQGPKYKFEDKKVAAVQMIDGKVTTIGQVTVPERIELPLENAVVSVEIAGEYVRRPGVKPIPPTTPEITGNGIPTKLFSIHPPKIFFGTNRTFAVKNVGGEDKYEFGAELSGHVVYGVSNVHIPVDHVVGTIEEVGWWNKEKGFYTFKTALYEDKNELAINMQRSSSKDTLLFVHGYRNTFDDAIIGTAQIAQDMRFKGSSFAFTWPSAGRLDSYNKDEKAAEGSIKAMVEVLQMLTKHHQENGGNLYIVAHSMGNRVLLMGIRDLIEKDKDYAKHSPIKVIALAAPDVDLNKFFAWGELAKSITPMMSFYYSTKDWALYGSEKIHTMNRAGLHPAFITGVDTICADEANSTMVGHNYFSSSDQILFDLGLQIMKFQKPEIRLPPLTYDVATSKDFGHPHWIIRPHTKAAYKK